MYPLHNDAELLAHLIKVATDSGIPDLHISVWAHLNPGHESWLRFHVADSASRGSVCSTTSLTDALAEYKAKYPLPTRREEARALRKQAEELITKADAIDPSEPCYPPAEVLADEEAQAAPSPVSLLKVAEADIPF